MSKFEKKVDFIVFVTAKMANANGDPLNGNMPRTDYNGYGEMSDVCIKRKIRNRMQDLGYPIFVQSEDRVDDGYDSLKKRAEMELKGIKNDHDYSKAACTKWMDVRSFGQVFAFKGSDKNDSVSVGVRGPVSIHQAVSISPINIESIQITKSVNGDSKEKKSSDRMGMKHYVRFGLYKIKGSINVQLAEKTGFSQEDADVLKECLRTLFVNDVSSARPDGSMEVVKLFWWQHNCKDGQYSSSRVHNSVSVKLKDEDKMPSDIEDYSIEIIPLDGLEPEVIDGI